MSSSPFHNVPLRPALLGVLALIAVVHLPLLGFQFVYDDGWTIVTNGFLRVPSDLPVLFSREALARHVPDAFRPGLVAFDVLTYQLLGLSSALHHALSIALHVGVCAALARWLRTLGAPTDLVLGTVSLFGLLAVHTEATAVVSFREDLLAALLGLLAADAASRRRLARAALLSLGACSMKLSAGAVPLAWLLAESLGPWRPPLPARARLAGFAALGLGVAAVVGYTFALYGALDPYGPDNLRVFANRVGLAPVLAASLQVHLGYVQQLVVPLGLSPEYVDRGASFADAATLACGTALLSLLGYGVWSARRRPVAALAIVGAMLLALPTSNLFAMPNMRADRFTYLPATLACVGLAALLLAAGRWLSRHVPPASRTAALVAPLALYCVLHGAMRVAAAFVYRNNGALWTTAKARAPGSARAHAAYGELVVRNIPADATAADKLAPLLLAEAHCRNAERLDPTYELPQLCHARVAAAREQWSEAYRRHRAALSWSPDRNAAVHAGLAETALDLEGVPEERRTTMSLRHLEEGLAAYPYSPELHAAAGRIFHRTGDPERATTHYLRALRMAPERPEALLGHVELLLDLGRPADASQLLITHRTAWLAAHPDDRTALIARHRDALRLFAPSLILSADPVGIFVYEP
jgi:tetratricopeptide (TPR) repeat protein